MDKIKKGTRVPKSNPLHHEFKAFVTDGEQTWGSTLKVSPMAGLTKVPQMIALQAVEGLAQTMRKELGIAPVGQIDHESSAAMIELHRLDEKRHNQQLDPTERARFFDLSAGAPTKRFHRSDSLVYEYNTIGMTGPNQPDLVPNPGIINRRQVRVFAGAGVKWQEIVTEWAHISNQKSPDNSPNDMNNPILTTCMVDYADFVVALTLRGFIRLVEKMPSYGNSEYEHNVCMIAKELVAQRDYNQYNETVRGGSIRKVFSDFYPKD